MIDKALYQAYLIRFQKEKNEPFWRVVVIDTQTQQSYHFRSELELITFLLSKLSDEQTEKPTS